jgi:hypothetical protein
MLALHSLKSILSKGGEEALERFEKSGGLDYLEDL